MIDGKDYIKHDMSLLLKIPILIIRQPCHLIKTLVEPIIPQNATILDVQCLEWVKEHVEEKMTLLPVLKGWFLLSLDCFEDGMRTIWITLWSGLLEHANATGNPAQAAMRVPPKIRFLYELSSRWDRQRNQLKLEEHLKYKPFRWMLN